MNRFLYTPVLSLILLFATIGAKPSDSKDWFSYAETDLKAAAMLADAHIIGYALYHIEQATEKALKAYLVATNTTFALTHDLVPLLSSCARNDADFGQFSTDIREINPYSTKSRYPNKSYVEPSISQVKELIARAASLLRCIAEKIGSVN